MKKEIREVSIHVV